MSRDARENVALEFARADIKRRAEHLLRLVDEAPDAPNPLKARMKLNDEAERLAIRVRNYGRIL
jgi:hypothetical protein